MSFASPSVLDLSAQFFRSAPFSHEEPEALQIMDLFFFSMVQPLMDLAVAVVSLVFVLGFCALMIFIFGSIAFFNNCKSSSWRDSTS